MSSHVLFKDSQYHIYNITIWQDSPSEGYILYKALRWRFGSVGNVVGRINEVNQRRARLVLGWVTVCRQVNHLGM